MTACDKCGEPGTKRGGRTLCAGHHDAAMKEVSAGADRLPFQTGCISDFVIDVTGHTEADARGILVQGLAAFGVLVGPGPYTITDRPQRGLISPVLVGGTAKARKGTGWSLIERLMVAVDHDFERRIVAGFGSGESIIRKLADPGDDDDPRPNDRRLLIVEEEWSRVLKVCARDSSILSAVLRNVFDGRRLEHRTVSGGEVVATGHHVASIGHIVRSELVRFLSASEVAGGFANRYLFIGVSRAGRFPDAYIGEDTIELHAEIVRRAVIKARTRQRVTWTVEAWDMWCCDLFDQMADDEPDGVLGEVVARPEPNVARMALLFALSQGRDEIDVNHLRAAWEVWGWARETAEDVWGGIVGNPALDHLLDALSKAPDGLTGGGVSKVLNGHNVGVVIHEGIAAGLIVVDEVPTGGRPRKVYRSANGEAKEAKEVKEAKAPRRAASTASTSSTSQSDSVTDLFDRIRQEAGQ